MANATTQPVGLNNYGSASQTHGMSQEESHWVSLGRSSSMNAASSGLMGAVAPRHQPFYSWY